MIGLAEALEASGLFDADWYVRSYPDAKVSGQKPLEHYLRVGAAENRSPHWLFDPDFYRRTYMGAEPDVSPLCHYLTFGMRADLDTHPLFETAWYRQTYMRGSAQASLVPLVHYTAVGSQAGYRPNRYFDPAFYRDTNPDVAAVGIDPLCHFAAFGEGEGRWPACDLDLSDASPDSVMSRVRPTPGTLASLIRDPSDRDRPEPIALLKGSNADATRQRALVVLGSSRPTIMIVSHRWGGGVARVVEETVRSYKSRFNVVLASGGDGFLLLTLLGASSHLRITINTGTDLGLIEPLIRSFAVERTIVHHIMDVPAARVLIDGAGAPCDVYLHDYHLISPQPHLVGSDGRFVGEELEVSGAQLLRASGRSDVVSLRDWQRAHRWLLDGASAVFAPSTDLSRRFKRRYPDLAVRVRPLDQIKAAPPRPASHDSGPSLRIALLGDLARHKGFDLVCDAARLAAARRMPFKFTLIGHSMNDAALAELGIEVTGRYLERDLQAMLQERRIDVFWFPSQCPETFSFTLSAALETGLPILASDLGAFPERLEGLLHAATVPWAAGPAEWIDRSIGLVDRMRVRAFE